MTNLVENETARTTSTSLHRLVLHRVAALPIARVLELANPRAMEWIYRFTAERSTVAARGKILAEEAALLVAGEVDDRTRHALIEIRRSLHNSRPIRHRLLEQALEQESQKIRALAQDVARWNESRIQLTHALEDGQRLLEAETDEARRRLADLAAHPAIRDGVPLASRELRRYLHRYTDDRASLSNKRRRSIEQSLLAYVYRTACKTSPFSSFTTVGVGPLGGPSLHGTVHPTKDHKRSELSVAVLTRVTDSILKRRSWLSEVKVGLATGLELDPDRLRYIRRVVVFNPDDQLRQSTTEDLFYLGRSEWLDDVVAVVTDAAPHSLTFGRLCHELHRRHRDIDIETSSDFLVRLQQLALLTFPDLHVDTAADRPAHEFARRLQSIDAPWAQELGERLRVTADLAARVASTTGSHRNDLMSQIDRDVRSILADCGASDSGTAESLVYEDVVSELDISMADESWLQPFRRDIEHLSSMLPVFDLLLPHRLVLRGFFRERYPGVGVVDDALRFVHEFQQDIYDQFVRVSSRRLEFEEDEYVPLPNWMNMPELDQFNRARAEVVTQMRARMSVHGDSPAPLVLDESFVDAVATLLPKDARTVVAGSYFIQVARGEDGSAVTVINRGYSGLGLMFSRFLSALRASGDEATEDELRAQLRDTAPRGAVFAELKGGVESTNLNLHPTLTDYELVCPGDHPTSPPQAHIQLQELQIRVGGSGQLELYSPRLDRVVIPVYLGFLIPAALPYIQRVLLLFSPMVMMGVNFWEGTDRPLGERAVADHPRLQYGSAVLVRRTWKTDPARLPSREACSHDIEWLYEWFVWRSKHGLPRYVFASADQAEGRPSKPQFVDFESLLSLGALRTLAQKADQRVVFVEMVPSPDQLWVTDDGAPVVAEHIIEHSERDS